MAGNDIPVEEISALVAQAATVMDMVSEKVPLLLRSLLDIVYSPEAGRRIGQSAGAFYAELAAAGIPADRALQLAEAYLAPLALLNSLVPGSAVKP